MCSAQGVTMSSLKTERTFLLCIPTTIYLEQGIQSNAGELDHSCSVSSEYSITKDSNCNYMKDLCMLDKNLYSI